MRSADFPDVQSAREGVLRLNKGIGSSHHVLIQDYLTLGVVLKATASYLKDQGIRNRLLARLSWVDPVSGFDISYLAHSHLQSDLFGVEAAKNFLWIYLRSTS